jgi:hypothetical protein
MLSRSRSIGGSEADSAEGSEQGAGAVFTTGALVLGGLEN